MIFFISFLIKKNVFVQEYCPRPKTGKSHVHGSFLLNYQVLKVLGRNCDLGILKYLFSAVGILVLLRPQGNGHLLTITYDKDLFKHLNLKSNCTFPFHYERIAVLPHNGGWTWRAFSTFRTLLNLVTVFWRIWSCT